jgi:lysophospholipase L1-like esterase
MGVIMKNLNGLILVALRLQLLAWCGALEGSEDDQNSPAIEFAAFGDSITRAFNANTPLDHPGNSWATGNDRNTILAERGQVKSHAEFLREVTGQKVIVHNAAKTGATSNDLLRQLDSVKDLNLGYATILIGANDLCSNNSTSDDDQVPRNLGQRVDVAIKKLITRNPEIKILLASIPNLPHLQRIGHGTSCQNKWSTFGICKNLLSANITQPELDLFTHQWQSANDVLSAVAANYPENVLFNWTLADFQFKREQLSNIDCFHPNIDGQTILSKETWATGWWGQ